MARYRQPEIIHFRLIKILIKKMNAVKKKSVIAVITAVVAVVCVVAAIFTGCNSDKENPATDVPAAESVTLAEQVDKDGILAKFEKADWNAVRALPVEKEGFFESREIVCLGEILEKNIRVYGYNDEEFIGEGLALDINGKLTFLDINYGGQYQNVPDFYWNDAANQLIMVAHVYGGTFCDCDCLYVFKIENDTVKSVSTLDDVDYDALIKERIGFTVEDKTSLVFSDKKTGEEIAWFSIDEGTSVKNLYLSEISDFIVLGDKVLLRAVAGYEVEGDLPRILENTENDELLFEIVMTEGENGKITFSIGDVRAV